MWIELCKVEDLVPDKPYYVEVCNMKLCVLLVSSDKVKLNGDPQKACKLENGDKVMVFDDVCPHMGASLSQGRIYDKCLVCPLHAWAFRICDGLCPDNERIKIKKYPAMIQNNRIMAEITAD